MIIVIVVVVQIFMIGSIYLMVYYQHPDDNTTELIWLYRVTVVSSLTFSQFLSFTLPLDCSCQDREDQGGMNLNMSLMWMFVIGLTAFELFILLPLCIFIYNSKSERGIKFKVQRSQLMTFGIQIVHITFIVLLRFVVKSTDIYYNFNKANFKYAMWSESIGSDFGPSQTESDYSLKIDLGIFNSIAIYLAITGSQLGIFIMGFGLANAPIMLINAWLNKPTLRDAEDYTFTKQILRAESEELVDTAKEVKNKQDEYNKACGFNNRRKLIFQLRRMKNKLRDKFISFEEVMQIFMLEENMQKSNPLIYAMYLAMGNVCLLVSFLIFFHTMFYVIPKSDGTAFSTALDGLFTNISLYIHALAAAVLFILLSVYIQSAILKGNYVVNTFFSSMFFGVQPFTINGTWMSSFLTNCLFLQTCSMGMLTWLCNYFPNYLRLTEGVQIFKYYMGGLPVIRYLFNSVHFVFVGTFVMFIISCIYLLTVPSQKARVTKIMQEKKSERTEAMKKDPKTTT